MDEDKTTEPEVTSPDVSPPDVSPPEVTSPDVSPPEVTSPDVSPPEETSSDAPFSVSQEVGGASNDQEEEIDLELWFQNMESRQLQIPESCDKYKATCSAIEQLQDLIREALDHRLPVSSHLEAGGRLSFSLPGLLESLATKQEGLLQKLLLFHRGEVGRVEEVVGEGERRLDESPLMGGYIHQQQKLHRLRETREELSSCEDDLRTLLEAPQPLTLPQLFPEQQMQQDLSPLQSPTNTPPVFSAVTEVRSKAQILLLHCQEIVANFDEWIRQLEDDLHAKRERFLDDLTEVEAWIAQAYTLLCTEPIREVAGSDEYSEVGHRLESGEFGVKFSDGDLSGEERYPSESADVFESGDEVFSDESIGSDTLGTSGDQHLLETSVDKADTSVNVDLGDEEYSQEVLKRVFSPEGDEMTHEEIPPVKNIDGFDREGGELSSEQTGVFQFHPGMESAVDAPQYWTQELEDAESVSSESTLRSEPDGRGSPGDVGLQGVKKSIAGELSKERVKSLADEFSEVGIKPPSEEDEGELVLPDGETQPTNGGSAPEVEFPDEGTEELHLPPSSSPPLDDSGGEEEEEEDDVFAEAFEPAVQMASSARADKFSLQRVKQLRLLPMWHYQEYDVEADLDQPDFSLPPADIDTITSNLQRTLEQMSTTSHKVKATLANINFVITSVPMETANQLQERLAAVKRRWEPLSMRLKHRITQLQFEKAQWETLESVQEAVEELEAQPKTNLLLGEIESKLADWEEFFVDLDSFDSQRRALLGQLTATMLPLQSYSSEDLPLLRETVESFHSAYRTLTEKVQWQREFLEQCRQQWAEFEQQMTLFEEWMGGAEETIAMETYGYSLQDTEKHLADVRQLKEQLPIQESQVEQALDLGNGILSNVDSNGDAENYVDECLEAMKNRWYTIISELDRQESVVNKVLINWRAYVQMFQGTQSFISQLVKMVGTEPLESSNGDPTLLPTYKTYASQLKAMQVQYDKLQSLGQDLTGNEYIGSRQAIREEMETLRVQWELLRDTVLASLEIVQREFDDWVRHKLQQMNALVTTATEVVQREVDFVEGFPLQTLLREDATILLEEADLLVAKQDVVNQLEVECVQLEEEILERQIQMETTGHPTAETENLDNHRERLRLQREREALLSLSESLLPPLNVFYLQLQLLQKVQEAQGIVAMVTDCVGEQAALEGVLADVQLKLSDDHFDQLQQEAYDLGAVSEELESLVEGLGEEQPYRVPDCELVLQVNRGLTNEIEALTDSANAAKVRLQLFLEWWAEFHSNHDDLAQWLEEAEPRLWQLVARGDSTQTPVVSPQELLTDATELESELGEKEVVVSAFLSTGQTIIAEFESKGAPLGDIAQKLSDIQRRWEALEASLRGHLQKYGVAADRFNTFLTSFTGFTNWLSEMHQTLYDEVCVAIPYKASDETIGRHRQKLEELRAEVESKVSQFQSIRMESGQWEECLVPDDYEVFSDESGHSSPVEEETDFFPLPYIKSRVNKTEEKWRKVQQRLQDREHQLEMCMGTMVVFLDGVSELEGWLREKLQLDALSATPPADLEQLHGYLETIEAVKRELEQQVPVKLGLVKTAESLQSQVSGHNVSKVEQRLKEVEEQWGTLETTLEARKEMIEPLIARIEAFWNRIQELESWLHSSEAQMMECGPIGAYLKRLEEQAEILEEVDHDVLDHKKTPEDVQSEAMNIINECLEGSGAEVLSRAEELQSQFEKLSQNVTESSEMCEEATSEMQVFQKRFDSFSQWLKTVEGRLEERRKTKQPIGAIGIELEEHYDFMREIEQQTDQYAEVYRHGNKLAAKYKPSDPLDDMMSSLHHRWVEFVGQCGARCEELLGTQELWQRYEKEVKELLSWVTSEADSFSKDMTTTGDKGIEDHIMSCKVLSDTLEGKKAEVGDIQDLAEILRTEDGEKKNGTSDVESRWNDVNQHWNSLCKLLAETLIRLEATYAKVRHVLQITEEEFDWLEGSEHAASIQRPSRGNLQIVQEEIDLHSQLLQEAQEHQREAEFIAEQVDFLVEHSRKPQREEIAARAADYSQRYQTVRTSLETYVQNLQDSIPVWREFNALTQGLSEWLDHVQGELVSGRLQSGNAIVTEASLGNAQVLLQDITDHREELMVLGVTGKALTRLCTPEDKAFIQEALGEINTDTEDVSQQTDERVEVLDQRLKSWQVFPVEEAKVVQAFLQEVQGEVEGEEDEEELSAEELQERLERLEALQEMQSYNAEKVSTIDQSATSEDVKKALESNPDISKERENLLEGWSSVSMALQEKIQVMKRKAVMVAELERGIRTSTAELQEYRRCLEEPLPPSITLETRQQEMEDRRVMLHNTCQASLSSLTNLLDDYTTSSDIPVPARLQEKTVAIREEFRILEEMVTERTNQIAEILASWAEFQTGLQQFSMWVRSSLSELHSLREVETFLLEFSALESRLELLNEEIEERRDQFDSVSGSCDKHLFGEEENVQQLQEKFSRAAADWKSLSEGVRVLPEAMQPWKDLTDRFDKLSDWFEERESRVSQDLEAIGRQEEEGRDFSDYIVRLKDHQLKMTQQAPKLHELRESSAALLSVEVCQQYEPATILHSQCAELGINWEQLQEKLQLSLDEVEDKAARWKEEATRSIRAVRTLHRQLDEKDDHIRRLMAEVETLRARPAAHPPARWSLVPSFRGVLFTVSCLILVPVVTFVVSILIQPADPRATPT